MGYSDVRSVSEQKSEVDSILLFYNIKIEFYIFMLNNCI